MQIDGKVFLVTGGASGLGEGTARMLAANGATVVIADMQADKGEAVAREIGGVFVTCDVTQEADGQAAVAAAQQLGKLVGLVNCAGIAPAARIVGRDGPASLDGFVRVIQVNLVGSFNLMRLVAAGAAGLDPLDGGERGVIVSTASIAAYEGQVGQAAYAASKAGIVGLTLPAARELAPLGIRVCAIAPGIFGTPMLLSLPQDVQDSLGAAVPFPARLGRPEEYADLVLAIVRNPMLNGETIRLDGALRMQAR